MKKLIKSYELETKEQYFDMCIESVINGQRTQAKEQFKSMPKENRKEMVKYVAENYNEYFNFFFNEL